MKGWIACRLVAAFIALGLAGCGRSGGNQTPSLAVQTLGGVEYGMLDRGSLTASDERLQGSGTVIFKQPLPTEDNHFALGFSLKDGGTLTLVPNAEAGLKGPVALTFGRTGNEMTITLRDGTERHDLHGDFPQALSAQGEISLTVDVHGHGHVIFWIGDQEEEFAFTSEVVGRFWGLKLEEATVTRATTGEAKKPH